MTRPAGETEKRDPWRAPVMVTQIPDNGLHRDIEADQAARNAMAETAGLREISSVHASFDLAWESGGRVHVTGRVQARVGQTCVVTLDPIENEIDEDVDMTFAPPDQISQFAGAADDAADGDEETADPPEPIENGIIDLGRLTTDVLYLAIDPYPRKADAVFEPQVAAADPADHPFAALKALQPDLDKRGAQKPKGK